MANVQRNAEKDRRWREILIRQASSGLAVRDFCKRERLTESQFYAWRRTIAERDGESSPSFVPVVVSDQPKSDTSIAIELVGGQVLKLSASTPAAWLAELVWPLTKKAVDFRRRLLTEPWLRIGQESPTSTASARSIVPS